MHLFSALFNIGYLPVSIHLKNTHEIIRSIYSTGGQKYILNNSQF